MSGYIGLLILGLIIAFFVILFLYLNRMRQVETGAEFARERGWQFQDALPQFGHAQRQQVYHGRSSEGLEWEMIINLGKSTTQTIPMASTIWSTEQIKSDHGIVLVGPKLDKFFDTLDLSNPLVTMFFRMILGDEADQIHNLQRLPIEGQETLTVLTTDSEYGEKIVSSKVLGYYQDWRNIYKDTDRCPIFFLGKNGLQFKVKKALMKAAEAEAFVDFCIKIAGVLLTT